MLGPARCGLGYDRAARSPRGSSCSAASPSLTAPGDRASMPSAEVGAGGRVVSARRSSASRASSPSPTRDAASTSSGSTHIARTASMSFDVAPAERPPPPPRSGRGRCSAPRPPSERGLDSDALPPPPAASSVAAISAGGLGFPASPATRASAMPKAEAPSRLPPRRSRPPRYAIGTREVATPRLVLGQGGEVERQLGQRPGVADDAGLPLGNRVAPSCPTSRCWRPVPSSPSAGCRPQASGRGRLRPVAVPASPRRARRWSAGRARRAAGRLAPGLPGREGA